MAFQGEARDKTNQLSCWQKCKAVYRKNMPQAKLLLLHSALSFSLGSSSDRSGIEYDCSMLSFFDLYTHCVWPLHNFWHRWSPPLPSNTCTAEFQDTTLSCFHSIALFLNLFCWVILILLTFYILKSQSSFSRPLFYLLSIATTSS